jgi:dTMP kinase
MRFVVIEGLDGSGKSTQLALLGKQLDAAGVRYRYLHFPRLDEGIHGRLVARFLRGEMGSMDTVDPYLVALIFAGDRAEAAPMIRSWIEEGYLVIADRYVYSNIAYQCAKLSDPGQREALRDWILDFEYGYHKLPRPDVSLFLNVPFEFTRKQLENEREGRDRAYLKGERDIHERDLAFQEKVRQVYLSLQQHVDDLALIECMESEGRMRSPETISKLIISKLNSEA